MLGYLFVLFVEKDVSLSDVDGRFKFNETKAEVEIRIKDDSRLESVEVFRLKIVIARRFRVIGVAKGTLSDVLAKIISDDSKLCKNYNVTYKLLIDL